MTTPMPPPEPLDAQERELARVLRALPGGEPPAALDAAILRAAANAAAASRRPAARLLASAGAMWGIGGAAAAVLALGVAIQMQYSPDRQPSMESAPRAQEVSDLAEDEAVQVELGEVRDSAAAAAAPPPPPMSPIADQPRPRASLNRRREAAPARAAAAAPPPAVVMPEPFAADALDEHVGRAANAAEAKAEGDAFAGADREVHAKAAAAQSAAAPTATRQERDARADSAAALGGLAAAQERAPMKPATWLAEIRRLRDEGKIEAARAKLVEFRQAYPQWVIPTDLAPLLSE